MAEVIAWVAVFFGGDLLALIVLATLAVRKDREKTRASLEAQAE